MSPRLLTSDPDQPGITRRRRGRGWSYAGPGGAPVDADAVARIEALVIPPAWRDVWICPDERGHLQAVGTDEAGRRQYRYHDAFTARNAAAKWERVERFGRALPELRAEVAELTGDATSAHRDLEAATGWCVRMLDRSLLRVGSTEYERRNGTLGLCTLRRRNVHVDEHVTTLRFVGKHGKRHTIHIVDPELAAALAQVLDGLGRDAPLLGWREGRRWRRVVPRDVNAFIAARTGGSTAKDFRSWHGSVLAAAGLVFEERAHPEADRTALVPAVVRQVALVLGNTPAVARGAYVHPGVVDAWEDGRDIGPAIAALASFEDVDRRQLRDVAETAVLDLLAERTPRTMRAHARAALDARR